MFRLGVMLLTAAFVLRAAPLFAHPITSSLLQTSMVASVVDPCALSGRFLGLHSTIVRLAQETDDAASTALHLAHRSTHRPYKRIENAWLDVTNRSESALDTLAYVPLDLEAASDRNGKKAAALSLTSAYQNAIEQFVDYAHFVVLYERSENAVSMNSYPLFETLNFGVSKANTKAAGDTYNRGMLDQKKTTVRDALRAVIYPEYRYGRFCKASFGLNAGGRLQSR